MDNELILICRFSNDFKNKKSLPLYCQKGVLFFAIYLSDVGGTSSVPSLIEQRPYSFISSFFFAFIN